MASENRDVILSVRNLEVTFGSRRHPFKAVKGVSFDIFKGETFGIVGESGSGKTTIGRAIIRVYPTSGGSIRFHGQEITGRIPRQLDREITNKIQMIFQDPMASLNERAKIDYIVSEGLLGRGLSHAEIRERVDAALNAVGLLPEFATRFPHEFSGGQRQRIGIARALVMNPEFIIADEPISALDVSIRAQVLNLMKKFQRERQVTYLFIAHDLSIVRFISDRIAVIYKGDIVEVAETDELFNFPLHPYTRSLISAIPIPDPQLEKNKVLFTYDPSQHDYSVDKPALTDIGHGHFVFGNKQEIEAYRAKREAGVPLKSITILPEDQQAPSDVQPVTIDEDFLRIPVHDTGSIWLSILSFFLPVLGLIAMLLFKHYHHFRNYRMCRKGVIAGFSVLAAILALFGLFLVLAVI